LPWATTAAAVLVRIVVAVTIVLTGVVVDQVSAQSAGPKRFSSPEDGVQALITAIRGHDKAALLAVLGADSRPLIFSGDAVADRHAGERFVAAYDEAAELVTNGSRAVLRLGKDAWPFPVPLVQDGPGWRFDAREGREELINRRVGANELRAVQVSLAYVDAQREYFAESRDGTGVLQYAQKFASTPGKRDGLYWETKPDEPPSPLGPLVARARGEGYAPKSNPEKPSPFHGYFYRILTAQGAAAQGGANAATLPAGATESRSARPGAHRARPS
jgi:hypothetical protein